MRKGSREDSLQVVTAAGAGRDVGASGYHGTQRGRSMQTLALNWEHHEIDLS